MKKVSLFVIAFIMLVCAGINAQEVEQLMTEFKATERTENIKQLQTAKAALQGSGIQSLDKMADRSSDLLTSLQSVSDTIPSVYARVFNEAMEGLNSDNMQKPTAEELESLAAQIAANGVAIASATTDLESVTSDVSKIRNPLQVKKAMSSLNYSKNVMKFAKDEVALQGKIVAALLVQLKSDVGL